MRPEGVPAVAGAYYDPLRAVKQKIQETTPHFAYFAESFLERPGFMAYGDEVEHLERSEADVTLGNLQSLVPGSPEFWATVDHYLTIEAKSSVTPAWTVITGDKDDPRFDHFHHWGELARAFTGLFLGKLPLYFSLGFEQRDRHFQRAANEVYSKLYVFQETRGDKAVSGPFVWGDNLGLFADWTRLQNFAAGLMAHLGAAQVLGATAGAGEGQEGRVLAWLRPASDGEGTYLFVAHFGPASLAEVKVVLPAGFSQADLLFATEEREHELVLVGEQSVTLAEVDGGVCYHLR